MYIAIMVEGVPDERIRSCFDCFYCQAAMSWWCVNKKAQKDRGTSLPGIILCPYWHPCKTWDELKWYQKLFALDCIYIKQRSPEKAEEILKEIEALKQRPDTGPQVYVPGYVGFSE